MRWLSAIAVGVALSALGAGAALADAPPPGALVQLPGQNACWVTTNAYQPPGSTCPVLRTNGRQGCLNCLSDAALTPDGLDLYVVDESTSTLMDLRRDPATGQIAQALGPAGCVSGGGLGGCTPARGIVGPPRKHGQPALPGLEAVGVSPDGANVYAAASSGDRLTSPEAVLAFRRDPSTGALAQLPGKAGCLSPTVKGCAPGREMDFASGLVVSPDGNSVYVTTSASPARLAVLRRSPGGGLRQLAGQQGCLSAERKVRCTKLSSSEESTLALSPDGKQAYIASGGQDDISIYARSPSGALRPQQRCITYQGRKPCGSTPNDQFISLTASPDGSSLYLVEGVDDRIVAFTRAPATGRLTKVTGPFGCGRSTPCPGWLSVASSVSFAPDSQVAYYALQVSTNGGFGGVVLYRHGPDGSLNPFAGPFGCVAQSAGDCQAAPGIRDPGGLVFSPDGHNAYVHGREGITAFSVAPPA